MFRLLKRLKKDDIDTVRQEKTTYFDRLIDSIDNTIQNPEMVEWFPTGECNARCQYCIGGDRKISGGDTGILSYQQVITIVKEMRRHRVNVWSIGGRWGEPLLYPHLLEVLKAIKENNLYGILITNGLLLSEDIFQALSDIQWDILKISLDASVPHIHDALCGVEGSFEKIDTVLKKINAIKNKRERRSPRLICSPVITNTNYKYVVDYIDYCIALGIDEIELMPVHNISVNNKGGRFLLSQKEGEELIALLKARREERRIAHNIDFIIDTYTPHSGRYFKPYGRDHLYCIHLWKTLVITEKGEVAVCSALKERTLAFKNSYLETWNGASMNAFRDNVLNGDFIDSEGCAHCCGPLRDETGKFNRYRGTIQGKKG